MHHNSYFMDYYWYTLILLLVEKFLQLSVIQYGTAFSGIIPFFAIYFYEYLNLFLTKKIFM